MDYKETDFSFLYDDLTGEYGNEQALMITHKEIQHNAHNLAEENAKLTKFHLAPRQSEEAG